MLPFRSIWVASVIFVLWLPSSVAGAELGFLTVCKGVSGPELNPVDPASTFSVGTQVIHAVANIKNGAPGAKIKGTWIAVDAVTPPNYEILSSELVLEKSGTVNAHFEISKPTNGWPKGNYRVSVYIDGKEAGSANFAIQ